MTINIRPEEPCDYRRSEEIARDAFWNLYMPGAAEHYVVHLLRGHEDNIPELNLVIEEKGELVGAIYYTHSRVLLNSGGEAPCITFGPVYIAPHRHRQGLGRELITRSLELARQLGHTRVLILGYPYHYRPYGFVGGKTYSISMPDGQYYTGLQALELVEESFNACAGIADFSPVFEESTTGLDEFDALFAPKEKTVLPSQQEYVTACAQLDE